MLFTSCPTATWPSGPSWRPAPAPRGRGARTAPVLVAEGVRGVSPATEEAVIGGVAGGVVGGVLGILGAIIGLVAERWMRSWGRVRCTLTSMEKMWRSGPDRRILAEDEVDRLEAFDQIEA